MECDFQSLIEISKGKYYMNDAAECVVRVDMDGRRYVRSMDDFSERGPISTNNKEVWGIPSYGVFNELKEITEERYYSFGRDWYWAGVDRKIVEVGSQR